MAVSKARRRKTHREEHGRLIDTIQGVVITCMSKAPYSMQFISNGVYDMTGFRAAELVGKSTLSYIHPGDLDRVTVDIHAQLSQGKPFALEYRMLKKNGDFIWVLDKGCICRRNGEESINSVIVDISHQKKLEMNLKLSERKYRVATEQSDTIVFEYDPRSQKIVYSGNFKKVFAFDPVLENFPQSAVERERIHREDRLDFRQLFAKIEAGERFCSTEFRLRHGDGSYVWCLMELTAVTDFYEDSEKIIGRIANIDKQRREREILEARASRDALTGLYNKSTVELMMKKCLRAAGSDSQCAFFIVDIDNFKGVNDHLGHVFGDAVLAEIGMQLRRILASPAILGRIGGDEFAVLFPVEEGMDKIREMAVSICKVFRRTFSGEKSDRKISGSVGISLYPKDGRDFAELYKNADLALYAAKAEGKDRYAFYEDFMSLQQKSLKQHDRIVVGGGFHKSRSISDIRMYIFDLLYKAKDIKGTVNLVLGLVGERFNVSRAYIFENSFDGRYVSNTYEWCNEGVVPEKPNLQLVALEQFERFYEYYDANGVFYCDHVEQLDPKLAQFLSEQGICSMLHAAIEDNGRIAGFIGFDECKRQRCWTESEIELLGFISKMIGLFLIKKLVSDELKHAYENQKIILDSMDSFTYVIDPVTYKLLYINRKTMDLVPSASVGGTCFSSFWNGRREPCKLCPMAGLISGKESCSMEIYNHTLRVWTEAVASRIPWVGIDEAVMLCCTDITRFKAIPEKSP